MDERINAGYRIVESHMKPNGDELVIGHNEKAAEPYVCWWCSNGSDYYWGYYCMTYEEARADMFERLGYTRVVRCGNCKREGTDDCPMHINGAEPDGEFLASVANDFCSYGEEE